MKCPRCRTENPATAKFCLECALALRNVPFPGMEVSGERLPDDDLEPEEPTLLLSLPMPTASGSAAFKNSSAPGQPGTEEGAGGITSSDFPFSSPVTVKTCMMEISERYRGLEKINESNRAIVYRAQETRLGRTVAIKRLLIEEEDKPDLFWKQARAIAALEHPNIVKLYDIGKDSAGYFLVMEYVEGETLQSYLEERGKLIVSEAAALACAIGRALAYAHRQGVVHGNLKPENIILDLKKNPRLVDFGLPQRKKSKGGGVTRSIYYAAPDVVTDGRSDIYSLGACLYQMVTGDLPGDVKIDNIPETVAPIVLKCMREKAEDRYLSLDHFLSDFEAIPQQAHEATENLEDPQDALASTSSYQPEKIAATKRSDTAHGTPMQKTERLSARELLAGCNLEWAFQEKYRKRARRRKWIAIVATALLVLGLSIWSLTRWIDYRNKLRVFVLACGKAEEHRDKRQWDEAIHYYRIAQQARFEHAVEQLRKAIVDCENDKMRDLCAVAWARAEQFEKEGKWNRALSCYREAQNTGFAPDLSAKIQEIERRSTNQFLMLQLDEYVESGEWPNAREVYLELLPDKGEDLSAYLKAIPPIEAKFDVPSPVVIGVDTEFALTSRDKIWDAEWDFGDGRKKKGVRVRHIYRKAGKHTFDVAVWDGIHHFSLQGTCHVDVPVWSQQMVQSGVVGRNFLEKLLYCDNRQVILDMTAPAWMDMSHERKSQLSAAYQIAWAKAEGKPAHQVWRGNGLSLDMALIPPGRFWQGSYQFEPGRNADETRHRVIISKGFYMSRYEVSQRQWRAVMGSNPSEHRGDNLPVDRVSWDDCQKFCQKTGLSMPTEAQWEYACRAGSTGPFNLGEDISPRQVNYDGYYSYDRSKFEIYRQKTVPVGSLLNANSWGCHDFHGNVWEWTRDWYGEYPETEVTDPTGPESGPHRVFRGGSWYSVSHSCRCAYRFKYIMDYRYNFLGFRVCVPL